MSDRQYSEALQPLFQLSAESADPYELDAHNFLEMGITTEHIPELTELILDEKYYLSEDLGYPQFFAYQALGQLKTESAIDALVAGTRRWGDSDWFEWFTEAMPKIFSQIGCSTIPSVVKLLQDATASVENRTRALTYLEEIGINNLECRDQCIAVLTEELWKFNSNDPTLNGFMVAGLVSDLKAVDAAPAIEAAYAADRVDESIVGDWYDAQVYLGLISAADVPKRERSWSRHSISLQLSGSESDGFMPSADKKFDPQKAKAKKKQQKQARKQNRRKK